MGRVPRSTRRLFHVISSVTVAGVTAATATYVDLRRDPAYNAAYDILSRHPEAAELNFFEKILLPVADKDWAKKIKVDPELAKRFKDEKWICARPEKTGAVLTAHVEVDGRFRHLQEAYAFVQKLPGYQEPWVPELAICHYDLPNQKKDEEIRATYEGKLFISFLHHNKNPYVAARSLYHENMHHRRNKAITEPLIWSGDRALNYLDDESNAEARTWGAAFSMYMLGERGFWNSIRDDWKKAVRVPGDVEALSRLYDRKELIDYVSKHRRLPPLMMRWLYVHMAITRTYAETYRDGLKNYLSSSEKSKITLDDSFLVRSTGYDGLSYLEDTSGMVKFLQRFTVLGHHDRKKSFDQDLKYHHENKNPFQVAMRDVLSVLDIRKSDFAFNHEKASQDVERLAGKGGLDFPFVVRDLLEAAQRASKMVARAKHLDPPRKAARQVYLAQYRKDLERLSCYQRQAQLARSPQMTVAQPQRAVRCG